MSLEAIVTPYLNALNEHYYATTCVQATTLVAAGDFFAQLIELNAANKVAATTQQPDADAPRTPIPQMGGASSLMPAAGWLSDYDVTRTARMGALGLVIAGFGTSTWLRHLEMALPLREGGTYSAYGNLPTWAYAPLLNFFQFEDVDQVFVSDAYLVVVKAILDACIWAPIANTAYLVLTPLSEGKSVDEVKKMLEERFVEVMKTELSTFFPYNLVSFSLVPPLVRPFTTGFVSMCFAVYISWVTHRDVEHAPEQQQPPQPQQEQQDQQDQQGQLQMQMQQADGGAPQAAPQAAAPRELITSSPVEPPPPLVINGAQVTLVGAEAEEGAGRAEPRVLDAQRVNRR